MAWHPCGMVMDRLRSGYLAKMVTIQGGAPVDVVWFLANDNAKVFKGPTRFRSRNWEDDPYQADLGEQWVDDGCGTRCIQWYNGAPPAPYAGVEPCGTDAVAARGAIPGVDPTFLTNAIGQAPCCAIEAAPELLPMRLAVRALVDSVSWIQARPRLALRVTAVVSYPPAGSYTVPFSITTIGIDDGPPPVAGRPPFGIGIIGVVPAPPGLAGRPPLGIGIIGVYGGPPSVTGSPPLGLGIIGSYSGAAAYVTTAGLAITSSSAEDGPLGWITAGRLGLGASSIVAGPAGYSPTDRLALAVSSIIAGPSGYGPSPHLALAATAGVSGPAGYSPAPAINLAATAVVVYTPSGPYGPNSPSGASNSATVGTVPWLNPSNVLTANLVYSTAALPSAGNSQLLTAINFGFTVPAGHTVNGVKVEVLRKCTSGTVLDLQMQLVKGGTISGTDHSSGTSWGTAAGVYTSYGGSADMWGLSLTPADVNATSFGVAIRVNRPAGAGTDTAQIDHIRITIY